MGLVTLPPPILQLVAPAAVAETGAPMQAAMTFAMPISPLQPAAVMAQVMVGALAQVLAARVISGISWHSISWIYSNTVYPGRLADTPLGGPSHRAHFLAHVFHHMGRYRVMYPDDTSWVHIIAVNLEESASEWLVFLHICHLSLSQLTDGLHFFNHAGPRTMASVIPGSQ